MSNLLDRASVVLTPTGFNNGEALCVKPEDGSGDFQFSRNSAATRVNAQGLVEDVQILSSNLVQNGDFSEQGAEEVSNGSFTNGSTDWTLGTGWSVGEDKAVAVSGASTKLTQSISGLSGKTCKVSFTLSNYGGNGSVRVDFGSVSSNPINTNGEKVLYGTYDNNAFELFKNTGFSGSITNISVKEVGQNWDLGSGWSIGTNKAIYDNSGSGNLNQSFTWQVGKKYKITFDIGDFTTNKRFDIFSGVSFIKTATIDNNTSYTILFDGDGGSTFRFRGLTTESFSITNTKIIEITDDTNLPRINYEGFSYDGSGNIIPDSGCGSWLWENQSTNLIEYSNDYADSYWQKLPSGSGVAPIITSNYAISPDGTQNADRIQFDATTSGSNSDRSRIRATLTLTDGADYTFSFYAKSTNGTDQKISILFDNSQISIKTITSEWQRYEATATQTGTGSFCGLDLRSSNASTSDILVYGIQIEEQSYSTSLIPTSGQASGVTRNQDLCNNGGTGTGLINSTEGVLYAEIAANSDDLTYRIFSINDGSRNNRVYLQYTNASNTLSAVVKSSNNTQANMALVLSDETNFIKVGFKYKANDFALWVNGVEVATDTSGLSPIGLNNLAFNDGTSNNFFGKTKCVAVWKEALSDEELAELTTI